MKRIFTFCVIIFFLSGLIYTQTYNSNIRVQQISGGYEVEFTLPQISATSITQSGEEFIQYGLEGFGITPDPGLPMLPQLSFNLVISSGETSPGYEIITRSVEENYIDKKIYPTQEPWEKSKSFSDRPFTINMVYYSTSGSISSPLVRISEPFIIAGVKAVTVTIFPFNYDPSANLLVKSNSARFKINLNSGQPYYPAAPESFKELFRNLFVNSGTILYTPTNNYLIITPPEYEAAMGTFASYKSGMGYNVLMVNTGVTGTTNTAILNYIQNRYNNISTRPEFILLVGDVDKIPEWIGIGTPDNPHTDLNYTLLEGNDAYADAFIGRFPVVNTTQLTNAINKSIFMESSIGGLPKKNIYMSSNDNWSITEGTHNFVIDSFFAPANYTNIKLYTHTYGATTQQLIDALNANQIYAIYSGHGSETSWADGPPLNQSQVNALNNAYFPFVYSFACLTGQMQYAECFGETWIRGAKGGSVFWGSSVTSYWDEDDILEKRLFRAMFIDGLKKSVPMFVMGKYYLVQYYGGVTATMRRYLEMYNCFGDPSIYQSAFGPVITHNPLPNTENLNGPYVVNCTITPAGSNIDPSKTKLFWTRGINFNDSISLINTGGNNWSANIPGNGSAATYRYYIKTADLLNRVTTSPGGAPSVYHSFQAMPDLVKPVIVHTALGNCPKSQWPCPVSANVTDNIGIDSVWVRWYKNNSGTGVKHFKMNNITGNTFSASFNSDTSQVNYNDSIFYRVFARDNSSNHNTDSTALYQFKIIAVVTACIGSGNTSVSYPFYTYYHDSRTQMIYTSSEIGASGYIARIGFNVASAAPQVMNGFNVLMQHTTSSTISGFVNTNWTTVYTGTYTVPGTGWQYIDLQTPFYYNGTQNLLIDVCFDNTSYTTSSNVYSTSAPNMTWHYHYDGGSGCTLSGGSAQSTRPNICFYVNLLVGNNSISSQVPGTFSLEQNYPNPFNPMTCIRFSLPKQGYVKLVVFDILGREVSTLINEIHKPGIYEAKFDGTNYASGVYFYRITAGDYTDVKKMILIK